MESAVALKETVLGLLLLFDVFFVPEQEQINVIKTHARIIFFIGLICVLKLTLIFLSRKWIGLLNNRIKQNNFCASLAVDNRFNISL